MIPAMPRVLLVALASLVLLAPSTGRAKCAMPLLAHQIVTHAADEIPAGGGVLVGWTTSTDWDSGDRDSTDPAARAGWRLRLKKTRVATTMEQLEKNLECLTTGNRTAHERIWDTTREQAAQLNDHEARIRVIENT